MNGLFGKEVPAEFVVKEIRGVGLNRFTGQPNRTTYALETWHIYPNRKVLAAISWHGTKEEAELITHPGAVRLRSEWHKEYGMAGLASRGSKVYLTLRDQFDTEVDYLHYVRSVSAHPAAIDKKLMLMEVRK